MAGRTLLPANFITRFSLVSVSLSLAADVVNGNFTPNDGATIFVVLNLDAVATHTLTIQVASGVDGLTAGPRSYTIPVNSAGSQLVGPWPIQYYGSQLLWNGDSTQLRVTPYSLFT